jgi:flagellar hook-length control protein FliK
MRLDVIGIRSGGPPTTVTGSLGEWRVGAILEAIAVRDVLTGQLALDIGNKRYPARLASGEMATPADGERLQVRVLRNSPVLALEALPTTQPGGGDDAAVSDALRRFVPRQESPSLMLANLAWIAQGKTAGLPRAVLQAATRLWQALPDVDGLSAPKVLEQSVNRSGAFLEATLAGADRAAITAAPGSDLKALMLSLAKTLREHGARPEAARNDVSVHAPVPTTRGPLGSLPAAPATFALAEAPSQQLNELARQTEGTLARLTTTQVANANPDPAVQSLLIELPVRHDDRASVLRLKVERDGSASYGEAAEAWTVEAALDLGVIGALHARVTLRGHRIGVQLRAESAGVVEALSQRAGELEAVLREAGLDVDAVTCRHGMPAGDSGRRPTALLDVRA